MYVGNGSSGPVSNNSLTFEVFQDEFVASVNEAGDIESSVNVEIRCEVKSKGTAGTAILKIVPEGNNRRAGRFRLSA